MSYGYTHRLRTASGKEIFSKSWNAEKTLRTETRQIRNPANECVLAQTVQRLDATLFVGVGAAFDFHAGRVRQAPRWMQRSGLEWFFRLACEPRRLWKRYLKNNPLFLARAILQLSRLRGYPIE